MTPDPLVALRTAVAASLAEAERMGRGMPTEAEGQVRAYARARRLAGDPIERVIVDVKAMVREYAAAHDLVFIPRLVGWTVAGYFAGSAPEPSADD